MVSYELANIMQHYQPVQQLSVNCCIYAFAFFRRHAFTLSQHMISISDCCPGLPWSENLPIEIVRCHPSCLWTAFMFVLALCWSSQTNDHVKGTSASTGNVRRHSLHASTYYMGVYATSEMSQVCSVHEHKMALSRALHCSSLLIAALLLMTFWSHSFSDRLLVLERPLFK